MPYTIDQFPIETSEPQIEVTLPIGRHELELVVVDTAGLTSLPDRVVIDVRQEKPDPPVITAIDDRFGLQGDSLSTMIRGRNLLYASEVKFYRDSSEDTMVTATIRKDGIDTELPIEIHVEQKAPLGKRSFTVTTPGGTGDSGPDTQFRVVGSPAITEFLPDQSDPDETVSMLVKGRNLFIEGEPAAEHRVEFLFEGEAVNTIQGTVSDDSTPNRLRINVTVGSDAKAVEYVLRLTTPAGNTVDSSQTFKVV